MRQTEIQSRSSAAKVLRATWAPSASQRAWARGASSWHEEGRRVSLWQAAVDSQRCRRARRLQSAAPASHAAALRTDRGYRVLLSSQRAAAALLAAGADKDIANNNCATALFMASQNGHLAVAEALLAAGAGKGSGALHGLAALHWPAAVTGLYAANAARAMGGVTVEQKASGWPQKLAWLSGCQKRG